MLETSILLVILVVVLYLLVKREEPKESKNDKSNTLASNNKITTNMNRVKIVKEKRNKRFESFNTHYGYVKNNNTPDSVFDFMDWYLLNNMLLTNNDYVDFDSETFLGYPSARTMYLSESRVYFLDENGHELGYYDIGFENEELIVNTDQGTYYINIDGNEELSDFRVELGETKDVIEYSSSMDEFRELENSQKPYYMQEHTISEDEVVDAIFEDDKKENMKEEVINPALSSGMVKEQEIYDFLTSKEEHSNMQEELTEKIIEYSNSNDNYKNDIDLNENRYNSESIDSSTNY